MQVFGLKTDFACLAEGIAGDEHIITRFNFHQSQVLNIKSAMLVLNGKRGYLATILKITYCSHLPGDCDHVDIVLRLSHRPPPKPA